MRIWAGDRSPVLLPLRCPLLVALSLGYAGSLYAASLRAGLLDIGSPYWVLSVGSLLLLSPLYHAILLPLIADCLAGRRPNWQGALRDARDRFPSLFLGEILVGGAVIAGGLLLVIPGVYLGMRLIYYKQAILLDRMAAVPALRESFRLSLGWRSTVGLFLLLAGLYGCAVGWEWLLAGRLPSAAYHVASVVGTALLLIWMNVSVTFSYVARRPRT